MEQSKPKRNIEGLDDTEEEEEEESKSKEESEEEDQVRGQYGNPDDQFEEGEPLHAE